MLGGNMKYCLVLEISEREVVPLPLVHLLNQERIIPHQGIKDGQIPVVVKDIWPCLDHCIDVTLWLSSHAHYVLNSLPLVVLVASGLEVVGLAPTLRHVEPVEDLTGAGTGCVEEWVLTIDVFNQDYFLLS